MPSPRRSDHHERDGLLLAAAAAIVYGAAYPATAIALRSFSPLAIAGLACTLALPVVIFLGAVGVLPRPSRAAMHVPNLLRLAILGTLGGLAFIVAINLAVSLSGPTVTGFVAPLYAVAAALLAVPILGERLRPVTLAAFALALVGTVLLAGGAPIDGSLAGIVLAVAGAVIFGLYIVLARRWGARYHLDATLITMATLLGRGPILLAIEAVRTGGAVVPADPDPAAVLALLTIAFGSSSSANLLLMASVRRVAAGRASAALLLTPVSSALLGALLLHELLTPLELVGALLVLGGIAGASGVLGRRAVTHATADEPTLALDPAAGDATSHGVTR